MANLNFTRNIGSASLGRSTIGFGSTALSGHVTPVFGQRTVPDRRTIPGIGYVHFVYTFYNTILPKGDQFGLADISSQYLL